MMYNLSVSLLLSRSLLLCLSLVFLVPSFSFGSLQQGSESAHEVVRTTLSEIFTVLDNPKLKESDKRDRIEDIVATRFDYREMSKRTLASYWNRLTEEERTEFVDLFKAFLSDRYAGKIKDYSGEKVEYLNERVEGAYAEIRTKLVSSKVEYPMDYRLINKDGRWYAYDIVADGVSLVKNYRTQFEKIIQADSFEELVRRMKDRTVAGERSAKR
jgi:phospholipid transport system substrate-binding protein